LDQINLNMFFRIFSCDVLLIFFASGKDANVYNAFGDNVYNVFGEEVPDKEGVFVQNALLVTDFLNPEVKRNICIFLRYVYIGKIAYMGWVDRK
jgi:hypothetical protein